MSRQVRVAGELEMVGDAKYKPNVKGDLLPERMTSIDWFDQVTLDTTNAYVQTLGGTSDAGALTAGGENGFKGTTGTGDNEISFLATALIFDITQKPAIASRLKISDVSGTVGFFGFSDATSETTPAATIDADSGTLTAAATDAVGFVVDADLGGSSIYCASTKSGAAVQSVDTGLDWADDESYYLRVELDASGNASFFVGKTKNSMTQVGYIAAAVADVPLCAILNYGTRANDGANTVYMRFLARSQDQP